MPVRLVEAMREMLAGWSDDLAPAWSPVLSAVQLGFDDVDPALMLEPWEPIFPARRGKVFPGAPKAAHLLRAFDGIAPADVRCVVLGQDPYPEPGFATGRAFEAGNLAAWRELDKMFSKSIRAYTQLILAARTGDLSLARSFEEWPRVLAGIENGTLEIEAPCALANRWIASGVLLLNSSLTLSRFKVDVDPHQSGGHLPLWRPLVQAVLEHLKASTKPAVFIAFGEAAIDNLRRAGLTDPPAPHAAILREHPAFADKVLPLENPFILCNRHLEAMGATPVAW